MSEVINYKVKFNNTIYTVGVKAEDSFRVFKAKVYSYTKIPPSRQQYPALLSTVYKWNDNCKIQQLMIKPNFTLEMVDKSSLPATDIKKSISHQEITALPVVDSGVKDTGGLTKPQTVLSDNKPECKSMFSEFVTETKSASKLLQTTAKPIVGDDPQFSNKGLIMDSSQSVSHPEVLSKNLSNSEKQLTVAIKIKTAKLESKSKTSASKEMTNLFTSAERPLLDTKQPSSSDKQSVQVQALEQLKAPVLASFDPGEPTFRFLVPLNRAPTKSTKPSFTKEITKSTVPINTMKSQKTKATVTSKSGDHSQTKPSTTAQPLKDMKKPTETEKFAPSTSKQLSGTEVAPKSLKKSKKQTKPVPGKELKCVADPAVKEKRASGSHKLLSYTKVISESLKHPVKKVTGATGPGNAPPKATAVSKVVTTLPTDDKPATKEKREWVKKAIRDEKCISGDIQQSSYTKLFSKSLKSLGKPHKDTKGSLDVSAAAARISKLKITPSINDKATPAGKHGAVKKIIKAEKCVLGDREQPSYTKVSSKSLRKPCKDTKGSPDVSLKGIELTKDEKTPAFDNKPTFSNLASVSVAEGTRRLSYSEVLLKGLGKGKPKSSDKPE